MSELDIFTEGTQQQILDELKVQNSLVKILASGWNIDSFAAVREIVKGGGGKRYLPVGTQLAVPHTAYGGGTLLFDVADHDGYKNPNDPTTHTMTLLMHDVIYGRQFDATEALYYVHADVWPNGLPAGTYYFNLLSGYDTTYGGGSSISFTTTKVVPVGGVIMFPWSYNTQASTIKVSTYDSRTSTTALETLAVTVGTSGTSLGTADGNTAHMNHTHRIRYGSNHWGESAMRQWLNSDAAANAWWQPQTEFDRPASYANVAGFMNGLDPDFLDIVGEVDLVTAYNTVYNAGGEKSGSYTTRDKFFLPSMIELGLGKNDSVAEGALFSLYDGAGNTDRIKYDVSSSSTARYWWMRSPSSWYADFVRYVSTGGSLYISNAYNGFGAVAACVIY